MKVRKFLCVWLGCAAFFFLMTGVQATTLAEYDAALGRVQAALTAELPALRANVAPTSATPPAFLAPRLLGPISNVTRPDGAAMPVNTSILVSAIQNADKIRDLKRRASVFDALSSQISQLRRALKAGVVKSSADPESSARTVLSGPDFRSDPLPPPSLSERAAEWIDKQLSKLRGPKFSGPRVSPDFIRAIFFLILAAALAILVYALVQAMRRQGPRAALLQLDEAEAALVEARDTNSLLALAETQAKAGEYRRAFRLVYLATLVSLDTDGVLRFDRSKTNWEYLRALRASGRPDIYDALSPLTREFDRLWYGFGGANSADYARALAQYHALKAAPQASASIS